MMKRTMLLLSISVIATLIFGWVNLAEAKQAGKVYRIGIVVGTRGRSDRPTRPYRKFVQRLRDLGYIEGQNLLIERRYGKGRLDLMPSLVNELVQQKVDVLFMTNQVVIRAAKKATKTIPIVMVSSYDPVALGHVDSLARPGGNITGIANLDKELSAKRVELLMEVVPRMSRLAILWDPDGPGPTAGFKETKAVAQKFKLDLQSLEIRGPNPDFEGAFQAAKKGQREALIIISNPTIHRHRKRIMELVTRNQLPSMASSRFVRDGALMAYASSRAHMYQRAATYVDKILKGANPGDLPVEQATEFRLYINLETANQLGITIPPEIMLQAYRVYK